MAFAQHGFHLSKQKPLIGKLSARRTYCSEKAVMNRHRAKEVVIARKLDSFSFRQMIPDPLQLDNSRLDDYDWLAVFLLD